MNYEPCELRRTKPRPKKDLNPLNPDFRLRRNYYKGSPAIYFFLVGVCLLTIAVLPWITIDVSVTSPGIIRPKYERAEIRSYFTAIMNRVVCEEGAYIHKDSVLFILENQVI